MPKFRFRLTALRKLREARRDELRAKLAEAHQAVRMLEEQLREVEQEVTQLQTIQRAVIEGTATDVNSLLEASRYQAVLRGQQSTMQDQIKLLLAEVERRRLAVVEADRQVRVLDKLEERQLRDHRIRLQRTEERRLDEVAARCGKERRPWD